ncbi:MAG: membrane protein insertion efficiency factor YidD [Gammaproteobacteria bacterium]|nr:membrane protein insertion efficiency factor YidD [Gammaproteobacteria bacterium]
MFRSFLEKISWPLKRLSKGLIKLYKITISPLLGNRCRFYPSCSEYASEAIDRYSFVFALWLIAKRLLKCQPLHKGGLDPLPDSHNKLEKNGLSKD